MKHERDALTRGERAEHEQQRQSDRVREQCLTLWAGVRLVRK